MTEAAKCCNGEGGISISLLNFDSQLLKAAARIHFYLGLEQGHGPRPGAI